MEKHYFTPKRNYPIVITRRPSGGPITVRPGYFIEGEYYSRLADPKDGLLRPVPAEEVDDSKIVYSATDVIMRGQEKGIFLADRVVETEPEEEVVETEPKEEVVETEPKEEVVETEPKEEVVETEPKEEVVETEPKEEVGLAVGIVPQLTKRVLDQLSEAGFRSKADVVGSNMEELMKVKHVGEETAKALLEWSKE